jgi:chemotaxis protein CheD
VIRRAEARAAIPDVYLTPGGLYAGTAPCRIGTLLGSCVAVTLWSRRAQVGGMNHYLLPRQAGRLEASPRHGETALAMLLARVEVLGAVRSELEAYVFGGAAVLATSSAAMTLGEQNVTTARRFLRAHRIAIVDENVGGHGARRVTLDVGDGSVEVATIGEQ